MRKLILALVTITTLFAEELAIPVLDGSLHAEKIGRGKPVVIVHGSPPLDQTYLRPAFEIFANGNEIIFYDQRGCGQSTALSSIHLETFINDLEAVRKNTGTDKITLIGHSWGAFLAMNYAISHPESVEKMILIGSMPASKEELDKFFTNIMNRLAPIHKELEEIESSESYKAGDPDTVEKQMKMVFAPYFFNQKDVQYVNFRLTRNAFLNGTKTFNMLMPEVFFKPYDMYPDLSKLNIPTLVIHGDYDPIQIEFAEHIANTLPHAKMLKLVNCGHFPHAEAPQEHYQAIKSFLNE